MGVDVINVYPGAHGSGTTGQDNEPRLHWGKKGIDETHTMVRAVHDVLRDQKSAGNLAGFTAVFGMWFDANASSAAAAHRAAFIACAWAAW